MKVISLFSGIGGIDLGFLQEGFEIVWANDSSHEACITYRHNLGEQFIKEDDIRNVDVSQIPSADILIAGFPCQPFSVMGYQRGFNDPRGNLFFEIARIIESKKPKIVFLENVENLMFHDNGKTFLVIYNTLATLGYGVKYKVMSATEYGDIPQKRSRIFITAFSDYDMLDVFSFPQPTKLTVGIDDIINRNVKHDSIYYYDENSKYYNILNQRIKDKTGIYRIDDSGIARRKYDICPTLKANMGTYHDRVPVIRDNFGIRKLTPYECLAFQGFPSKYKFRGISLSAAYKQCGNTVVVPVVKRIAQKIKMLY